MNNHNDKSGWPEITVISSRNRYTKKHGGVIWKIAYIDFQENDIGLVSLPTEEHPEKEEWSGTGQEFQERFVKIE